MSYNLSTVQTVQLPIETKKPKKTTAFIFTYQALFTSKNHIEAKNEEEALEKMTKRLDNNQMTYEMANPEDWMLISTEKSKEESSRQTTHLVDTPF